MATNVGVYVKTANEVGWRYSAQGMDAAQILDMTAQNGVFVAVGRQGGYLSRNAGRTWISTLSNVNRAPFESVWQWKDTIFISAKKKTLYTVDLVAWTPTAWGIDGFGREKELSNGVQGVKTAQSYFYRGNGKFEYTEIMSSLQYNPGFDAIDGLGVVVTPENMYISEDTLPPFVFNRIRTPTYQSGNFPVAVTANRTIIHGAGIDLFRTEDLGKTWDTLTHITNNRDVIHSVDFVEDPDAGMLVFVSRDSAILMSHDDGRTFTDISAAGPTVPINKFYYHQGIVYALTDGQGIWTLDLTPPVGVSEGDDETTAQGPRRSDISYVDISGDIAIRRKGLHSVQCFTLLGTVVLEVAVSGDAVTLPSSSWSSGMYYCVVRHGGNEREIIVLRR